MKRKKLTNDELRRIDAETNYTERIPVTPILAENFRRKIIDADKALDESSKRLCLAYLKLLPHQRKKSIEFDSRFYSPSVMAKEVRMGTFVGKAFFKRFKGELTPKQLKEQIKTFTIDRCAGIGLPRPMSALEMEKEAAEFRKRALEKIR